MASLKNAVKLKCIDCSYDEKAPGTALFQVENCKIKSCPLWLVRPLTIATINLNRKSQSSKTSDIDVDSIVNNLEDE